MATLIYFGFISMVIGTTMLLHSLKMGYSLPPILGYGATFSLGVPLVLAWKKKTIMLLIQCGSSRIICRGFHYLLESTTQLMRF
jgi:hypothetical protein